VQWSLLAVELLPPRPNVLKRLGFEGARLKTWIFWRPGVKWNPQFETTWGKVSLSRTREMTKHPSRPTRWNGFEEVCLVIQPSRLPPYCCRQSPVIPQFPSSTPVLLSRVPYPITASHCCDRLFLDISTRYDKRGGR